MARQNSSNVNNAANETKDAITGRIIQTVNMALGSQDPNFTVADLNSDGIINVLDVILIANMLLDGRISESTNARVSIDAVSYTHLTLPTKRIV